MVKRAATVVVLALASVLAACGGSESPPITAAFDPLVSQNLPGSPVVGSNVSDVELPDVARGGEPFAMRADGGGVLVVYFGFTFCPDVCPTTLADLKAALRDLGDDASLVDVAMVTIDPERDEPSNLTAYLSAFVDDGYPLRTDDDAVLRAAADAFGADYAVVRTEGEPTVYHSPYLYAVDDQGVITTVWPFGTDPERLTTDLAGLLSG